MGDLTEAIERRGRSRTSPRAPQRPTSLSAVGVSLTCTPAGSEPRMSLFRAAASPQSET